ncbi:MAG: efflux RND transporter periplasmic adaptor subunit [Chitinophagales bacterium]
MQKIMNLGVSVAILFLASCGATTHQDNSGLAEKKAQLQKLKKDQDNLATQIQKLETEIAKEDSSFGVRPKLVSLSTVSTQNFFHYIDFQGKIATENIYYIAPRGQGGQVRAVYVKMGDVVKKGQLILKLEDAVMLQNLKQLEADLAFAKDLYQRQQNLWDQKIGTEVQLITAKNNVDKLEKQIAVLKEQWSQTSVYSEVAGIVETVNIHAGEMFGGGMSGTISIVNPDNLKAVVEVPENYLTSVRKGTAVLVEVPDINKQFESSISLVSQLISNNSRAFNAEAKLPSYRDLKPNQVALVKIQDYAATNAIVVPMTTLQTDETGKFVYVSVKENGKMVARKKNVTVGAVYGEKIEIRSGLQSGDQLITGGFQELYDGQAITTS